MLYLCFYIKRIIFNQLGLQASRSTCFQWSVQLNNVKSLITLAHARGKFVLFSTDALTVHSVSHQRKVKTLVKENTAIVTFRYVLEVV